MRADLDLEKIKAQLKQSSLSAQRKRAAALQAYHQSMNELTAQLVKLKARTKAPLKRRFSQVSGARG